MTSVAGPTDPPPPAPGPAPDEAAAAGAPHPIVPRDVLRAGLAAAGMGAATLGLWRVLGLPEHGGPLDAPFPGAWRWVSAVALPLVFPAFTAAHAWLARAAPAGAAATLARAAAWERRSLVLLPLFLAWLAAWGPGGHWRLALGAFLVTLVLGKALTLVATLYHVAFGRADPEPDGAALPGAAAFLFLAAFLLYAGLVPYVVTAVSTAGDEPVYLLSTHSIWADGDVRLEDNTRRGDAGAFYWGRGRPWERQGSFVGFPLLLLPGYAAGRLLLPGYPLGGRLGATLVVAAIGALAAAVAYRLCRDLGCPRPAAFWAWVVLALTPPFIVASGHVYPELPAALLALALVRVVLRLPAAAPWRLAAVAAGAAGLVLLKERYAPLAVGLLAWAAIRLDRRSRWLAAGVLGAAVLGAAALVATNPLPALGPGLRPAALVRVLLDWPPRMGLAALGLLVDQEFGLLFYAPAWVLAAAGVPALWRRQRGATVGLLALVAFYLLVVLKYRWYQWDAGWTPPPRFILPAAPLLIPFVGAAIESLRGPGLAAFYTVGLAWSGALAWSTSLVPFWRYNGLTSRSTVLRVAGEWLGLDLARFLPSLWAPSRWTWVTLGAAALALALAVARVARGRPPRVAGWGTGAVLLRAGPAAALLGGLALAWLAAAAGVPTGALEGEAMRHSAGIPFGAFYTQEILWVMTHDGELSERIVTWPGTARITVVAGGYSTTGVAPHMTVSLDGRTVGEWTIRAGAGEWARHEYVATTATRFGRPVLRIGFTRTLDHRRSKAVQHAYVDRITIERVAGP
jgi:hypothetical protein